MTPATPARLGYRLPGEFRPHQGTWLAWPHNEDDWPGCLEAVKAAMSLFAAALTRNENVWMLVASPAQGAEAEKLLARAGADLDRVDFLAAATNRAWTRDYAPLTLTRGPTDAPRAQALFTFNGWARFNDHELDAAAQGLMAAHLGFPVHAVRHNGRPLVLEGGALDTNGQGDLLVSRQCLLDTRVQPRNPWLTRSGYEQAFADHLGIGNTIWLDQGLAGDDTHGHVDDFCRFAAPGVLVLCRETDPADPNHRAMERNREILESSRLTDGSRPEIVRLPLPAPLFLNGERLPASYANFAFSGPDVLVPAFDDPADAVAAGILAEATGRRAVGIPARHLVVGGGSLHCLSMQVPLPHREKTDTSPIKG